MAHKLLLADDSVTIQRVIELTFADEDVEVTTVGDGQLAIDRLDIDPPDIILADIDMPKRDGYEVAAYVKSRPKLAHIPVVLLTGAFEPIDQVRAKAAGSSDVLAKPFEPQMVINRVKELLGRKRQEPASEVAAPQPPQPLNAPQPSQTVAPKVAPAPSAPPVAAKSAPPAVAPPPAPQPVPGPAASGAKSASDSTAQPVSLDDYFDQLDAAFSNIQPGAPADDAPDGMDWPLMTPASQGDAGSAPVVEKRQTPAPTGPVAVPMASAPKPVAVPPPASAFAPSSLIASTSAPQSPIATVDKSADKSAGAPVSPIASTVAPASPTAMADKSAAKPAGAPVSPIVSTVAPASPTAMADKPADKPVASTFAPSSPIASADKPVAPVAPSAPSVFAFAPSSLTATADRPVASAFAPTPPVASADKPIAPVAPNVPVALDAPIESAPSSPRTTTTNPFASLSAAKAEAAARPAAPVITDEIIEEIITRVLSRMTDKVVRETVSDIVSQTAERLVQEEIDRIKEGS